MEYIKKHGQIFAFSGAFLLIGIAGMAQNARNDAAAIAPAHLAAFNQDATATLKSNLMLIQPADLDLSVQPAAVDTLQVTRNVWTLQPQNMNGNIGNLQGSNQVLQSAYVNATE